MTKRNELLNVWSFEPEQVLRVVETFKDGGGNTVENGTILHFEKRDFLPYHDGHTVYFEEVTLYLCGLDDTEPIVENRGNESYESYTREPPPPGALSQADLHSRGSVTELGAARAVKTNALSAPCSRGSVYLDESSMLETEPRL